MTDREMLEFCLKAFEAIPTALTSKLFMKQSTLPPHSGSGSSSYLLAKKMQRVLRKHLGREDL